MTLNPLHIRLDHGERVKEIEKPGTKGVDYFIYYYGQNKINPYKFT